MIDGIVVMGKFEIMKFGWEFWFTDGGRKSSRELELEPGTETIVSTLAVGPL